MERFILEKIRNRCSRAVASEIWRYVRLFGVPDCVVWQKRLLVVAAELLYQKLGDVFACLALLTQVQSKLRFTAFLAMQISCGYCLDLREVR